MKTKEVKKLLLKKDPPTIITPDMLLHTGSTQLNLALTDNHLGGFIKGKYYHLVGDSASGKTFLSLTCLAEAGMNRAFKDYRFIFDDIEGGNLFNIRKLFPNIWKRIEPPRGTRKKPEFSYYLEDLYFNLDDAFEDGRPFIYIGDSMDGLQPMAADKKFKKLKEARRKGKEDEKGSMGMDKAKINSEYLRKVMTPLRRSGSILILISQTRESADMFSPKTNSGGRALKFYATSQIWSSRKATLKKSVRGKERKVGIEAKLQVKKNRATGKDREITVPIFQQFEDGGGGFDDIGSCIDFLVEEKHWKKNGQTIDAPEFKFAGIKEKLIRKIEDLPKRYYKLTALVGKVWNEIEAECSVERKNRYA